MRRVPLLLTLLVTACGQAGQEASEATTTATETSGLMPPSAPDASGNAAAPPAVAARTTAAPPPASQPGPGAGAPMLAYSYSWTIRTPLQQVAGLAARHEQACVAAGPQLCQVVSATSRSLGEDEAMAELSFRATPSYVQRFRAGLTRDVQAARGEISNSAVATEDLTRGIVDTEAALRSGRILQARLEQLIASRPGNLQQLLEMERELARVRGEIDARQSSLEVMRARVSMSAVNISYASRAAALSDENLSPLAQAGSDFVSNVAASLAAILSIFSLLLPWLLLAAAGAWGWLTWMKRRRRKPAPTPAPPTQT